MGLAPGSREACQAPAREGIPAPERRLGTGPASGAELDPIFRPMTLPVPVPAPHPEEAGLREATLWSTPIRDLGLTIRGTSLEPILAEFNQELEQCGFVRFKPRYYLSTEWGVPFETVAIAIPFYLARPELMEEHARRVGHVEGMGRRDILRYLRHEMGHVVNYAYRLFDDPEWAGRFGPISQPYLEEYQPKPFSRRYVQHLPGWYAQKHPDEDWAETFAVWMTPGLDWREEYAGWPEALAKLQYCDRVCRDIQQREPVVTSTELDEDVGQIDYTLEDLYDHLSQGDSRFPVGLDRSLRAIFEELEQRPERPADAALRPASLLIHRLQGDLMGNTWRWTGHFPERTRILCRYLAERAAAMRLRYAESDEPAVTVAIATIVTALAMNYVHRGTYLP